MNEHYHHLYRTASITSVLASILSSTVTSKLRECIKCIKQ
jgi:hypothetical protein